MPPKHCEKDLLKPLDVGLERAGRHELRHHDEALPALGVLILPGVVESNDVGVLEALEHFRFFLEPLALLSLEVAVLQLAPGYGDARFRVQSLEDRLESASSDFLLEL